MNQVPVHPVGRRRGRTGLIVGSACAFVLAAAAAVLPGTAQGATGTNYQQNWSNGQGKATFSPNMGSGSYTVTWSSVGNFVSGIGWKPGSSSRTITFTSNLKASGGTTLITLYGWSTNPLIEYYVIENWGGSPSRAGTNKGQVTSDGGTYDLIQHQQVNQPSIQGNTTFNQYLAIRTSPRTSGTITFANFVKAWASKGMNLGSMDYQIMATEGWGGGSGSATVTVSDGGSSQGQSSQPSQSAPASQGQSAPASQGRNSQPSQGQSLPASQGQSPPTSARPTSSRQ